MKTKIVFAILAMVSFFASCKKSSQAPPPPIPPTETQLLMDSVYLYSKECYFWNTVLPTYDQFNPRQYSGTSEEASATNVLEAIKKLQTQQYPLQRDHYSFVTTLAQSSGLSTGVSGDYGFFVKAAYLGTTQPINYDSVFWFVNYVYSNSSAGLAGVNRGWIVSSINGTPIKYDQPSVNILNNTFFGSTTSASFGFTKPDHTTQTSSLSQTSYTANSVLYKNVFNTGGKTIGYFVFNQFFGAPSRAELANVFTYFQGQGVTDLIVDLRYNRGGETFTQDTLSELIAPLAAKGKAMYSYQFNQQLQSGNYPLLAKYFNIPAGNTTVFSQANNSVSFSTAGTLNLNSVVFITSRSTASASELLINNLRPYITNMKLVGDTTYGKPVGFFPINIFSYAIYPISFRTVNSVGTADYYAGFAPDQRAPDGVNRSWGDVNEPSLAEALKYITTGAFRTMPVSNSVLQARMEAQNMMKPVQSGLESHLFTGMFKARR
jgi:C-terminal processing protease CtpA/Prc